MKELYLNTIYGSIDDMEIKSDWHYVYGLIDMALLADKISRDEAKELKKAADKKLCELDRED